MKHIVFVGMMGSGKSSVGRFLAPTLRRELYDIDAMIEGVERMRIADLFEAKGEPYFRELEARTVDEVLRGAPGIVSLGGGAFLRGETRALVAETGISFYLKAEPATLLARVGYGENRPLLKSGDMLETLTRLLSEREPVYETALFTIPTEGRTIHEVGESVLEHRALFD